jgi:aminomethyltransferase
MDSKTQSQKTALYDEHIAHGAKMVEFAGYLMPVRYTSLQEEHMAVRNSVGVFDVSHMGEFMVSGPEALQLIQRISSNDASTLTPGQAQYSCMPNATGGIIDDLIIYCITPEQFMLVVNASNIKKDWDWIQSHNTWDCTLTDQSDEISLLAVQGPKAAELLSQMTDVDLGIIPYYNFTTGTIFGIDDIIISATGYTGSGGFELYIKNEHVKQAWTSIFAADVPFEVLPAGIGSRDTLRLEMGYCLYGNDIDDTTSPIEAGLSWITKFNHNFVNHDSLLTQKEERPNRRLIGFKMADKGIPRTGYDILNEEEEIIGKVTSGTLSPMLQNGIGLGYVEVPYHKKGANIKIAIRKKKVDAVISRPPFVTIANS